MDNFTQELMTRLDALTNKLGVASTAIWGFYLKQARIEGIEDFVFGTMFLILALVNSYFIYWLLTKKKEYVWGCTIEGERTKRVDGEWVTFTIPYKVGGKPWVLFSAIPLFICLSIAILFFYSAATEIYNPGYYAFQHILNQVR